MTRENKLVTLASKMMLTPNQAIALPSAIERAAVMMGVSESWMLDEVRENAPLACYIAHICRQVMTQVQL